MSRIRYTKKFKQSDVSQSKGSRIFTVKEVSERLGISTKSLYAWISQYHSPVQHPQRESDQSTEIRRLKTELARVKEERDILKKATAYFARDVN